MRGALTSWNQRTRCGRGRAEIRRGARCVGRLDWHRLGLAGPSGATMTTMDIAELLAEVRALRQEIAEIKLSLAEERGRDLGRKVESLEKRVNALELWRSLLIGASTAAGLSSAGALLKLFGG